MEKTVENSFQMKQILEKFDTTLKALEGKIKNCLVHGSRLRNRVYDPRV